MTKPSYKVTRTVKIEEHTVISIRNRMTGLDMDIFHNGKDNHYIALSGLPLSPMFLKALDKYNGDPSGSGANNTLELYRNGGYKQAYEVAKKIAFAYES